MYHNFLIHSLTEGDLACFQVLAIMNKASINIHIHQYTELFNTFEWTPRSAIVRSHNKSTFGWVLAFSVLSSSLQHYRLQPIRLHVHGIFQARILEWVATSPFRIFLTQGLNPHLLCLQHWQADSLVLSHLKRYLVSWETAKLSSKVCVILYSHQQWMRVSVAPHAHQPLVAVSVLCLGHSFIFF